MQYRRKQILILFFIGIVNFGNNCNLFANELPAKIIIQKEFVSSSAIEHDIRKGSVEADTSVYGNKIEKIWNNGQVFIVKLRITAYKDRPIRISLVNLIGKEVKVIYEGLPKDSDWEYYFSYSDIPSGVYICVLSSSDYRDAKKIVISK